MAPWSQVMSRPWRREKARLMGPKGMPPALVERIHGIVATALTRPAVLARMAQIGADPLGEGPAPFAARLREDGARWGEVVRSAGITLQ